MVQDISAIWPKVLDELKKRVTEQQFNTWFCHLEPDSHLGPKVELRVPGPIYKEWLARRYKPLLEEVFSSVSEVPVQVAFTSADGSLGSSFPVAARGTPPSSQVYLNRKYTFENFIVGNCNRLAHAAALSVVSSPGYTYNPLFICGTAGSGKTHLLQAIHFALLSKGVKSLYVPCEGFISHFTSSLRSSSSGGMEALRSIYRGLDTLLIDDIEGISRSPSTREELFHTFNALFNKQRQVVLSANCSPDNLSGVEGRLISRFKWGLVATLEPADMETKTAIVEKMASLLDLPLSKEAASFLAESISGNIKEASRLLGFLFSLFPSSPLLSLPSVKEALHGLLPAKGSDVHMEEILRAVSSFFKVPQARLQSKDRSRSVSLPRQVAMYLARRFTPLSLQEVGGYLGGRDHSTVAHAEKRISTLKAKNQNMDGIISQIEMSLLRRC